jgi:hypothetical protein
MKSKAKKMNFKVCLVAFLILSGYAHMSFSQMDNTIHLLPIIPQSVYTNPAFKPKAKFFMGCPALSSLYIGIAHTGFNYHDLINRRSDDSLEITMDNVISKLANTNFLSVNLNEELFAMGFKARKSYITFSVTEKASFRFGYPKDLIALAWKGNGQFVGKTLDLSGIGVNGSLYNEIALGYMRDVRIRTKTVTIGARFKYLQGMANIWTQKNDITVDIDEEDFAHTAHTDFIMNICVPEGLGINLDSINSGDSTSGNDDFDPKQYLLHNPNKGLGIDLGAYYKLNKSFSFGASFLDIGYINWGKGEGAEVRNYTSNVESFKFDGIDINQFFNEEDSVIQDQFNDIGDSIVDIFKISTTKNSYKAPLPAKMYLTAIYTITKHDKVGLLMRGEFFNRHMYPSFTVSYNKWFGRMLSAAVSYSVMNRSYLNLGFAMAMNLGPFQGYVSTDNFYCLLDPESTKTINIHFGLNLIIGYKDVKPNYSLFRIIPKEPLK